MPRPWKLPVFIPREAEEHRYEAEIHTFTDPEILSSAWTNSYSGPGAGSATMKEVELTRLQIP
jgi:hypothetical protein